MFMMIENAGVAPVQSFTVLGLSTARGKADKIGQFGSGSKHGILACLRQGINPTIFLGEELLNFSTIDGKMGEKEYKSLTYSFKGETKELPIALEFGALDWNGLDMGLREFVSNAIDAGEFNVTITQTAESQPDKTRVFLPLLPDVMRFYSTLREKFLHFSPEFKPDQTIIEKAELSQAKFYRKGVYVQESKAISLFNYNFGDDVKINESRVMEDWAISHHAAQLLTKAEIPVLEQLFRSFDKLTDKVFETTICFDSYDLRYRDTIRKNWQQAWRNVHGNAVAAEATSQSQIIAKAVNKGVEVVVVPMNFFTAFMAADVPIVNKSVENVDEKGREVVPAKEATIKKVRNIWDKLVKIGVTKNKEMPRVNEFVVLSEGQEQEHGFWNSSDDSINLESTIGITPYCILHELGHYITRSQDNTHDFTDFFCKVATILLDN